MKVAVRATPEEWEVISPFIRNTCKTWRIERTLDHIVIASPKAYFADRIEMFRHLYGHQAEINIVLGLDDLGRYKVNLQMSDEDATLLRLFHTDNVEMVAE